MGGSCSKSPGEGMMADMNMMDKISKMKTKPIILGRSTDFRKHSMKQIDVVPLLRGDSPTPSDKNSQVVGILVGRTANGKLFATSSRCPHYFAPLEKGTLCHDRVVCPWHFAAFNVHTGDIEDAPSLNPLLTFPISEDERGYVTVELPDVSPEDLPRFRSEIPGGNRADASQHYVIVGGGASSVVAIDTLRKEGFTGKITVVSAEEDLPYDRVKLSKTASLNMSTISLRPAEYFRKLRVEFLLGKTVSRVSDSERKVCLESGEEIAYDKALVCTGGSPRQCPGTTVAGKNVFTLRYLKDHLSITKALDKGFSSGGNPMNVVVIGSGFIGLEIASAIRSRSEETPNVTIVGNSTHPLARLLGDEVGERIGMLASSKSISLMSNAEVVGMTDNNGVVSEVKVKQNKKMVSVPCDLVVVCIGVTPNVACLQDTAEVDSTGGVKVDSGMKISESLYACGDIASFPYSPALSNEPRHIRVEHWDVAQQQARVAAKNMAGKSEVYDRTPVFWTALAGVNLRYAGHGAGYDKVIIKGSLNSAKFAAFYTNKKGDIIAVATIGMDPVASTCSELMRLRKMPNAKEMKKIDESSLAASLGDRLH